MVGNVSYAGAVRHMGLNPPCALAESQTATHSPTRLTANPGTFDASLKRPLPVTTRVPVELKSDHSFRAVCSCRTAPRCHSFARPPRPINGRGAIVAHALANGGGWGLTPGRAPPVGMQHRCEDDFHLVAAPGSPNGRTGVVASHPHAALSYRAGSEECAAIRAGRPRP